MTSQRTDMVLQAQRKAIRVRQELRIDLFSAVCIYDVVSKREVELKFIDIPSLEGMYVKKRKREQPIIYVSSLRPAGRQAFTCAHELGHHEFGHGSHIDDLMEEATSTPEEFLANSFASHLLMPKSGVAQAFGKRGWNIQSPTPLQVYRVASYFGVGYKTLIHHMSSTLGFVTGQEAQVLQKVEPKKVRDEILGFHHNGDLVIADKFWLERPIDARVDDMLLLPSNTSVDAAGDTAHIELIDYNEQNSLYHAVSPGVSRLFSADEDWSAYVRISQRVYVGRSVYRHLEETDDD